MLGVSEHFSKTTLKFFSEKIDISSLLRYKKKSRNLEKKLIKRLNCSLCQATTVKKMLKLLFQKKYCDFSKVF